MQTLTDIITKNSYNRKPEELRNIMLESFREWLEQKRLEYLEANRVFSIIAIDELLDELKGRKTSQ